MCLLIQNSIQKQAITYIACFLLSFSIYEILIFIKGKLEGIL